MHITRIKEKLCRAVNKEFLVTDMSAFLAAVEDLEAYPMTVRELAATKIGITINDIRKVNEDKTFAKRLKRLLKKWQSLLKPPEASASTILNQLRVFLVNHLIFRDSLINGLRAILSMDEMEELQALPPKRNRNNVRQLLNTLSRKDDITLFIDILRRDHQFYVVKGIERKLTEQKKQLQRNKCLKL